MVIRHDTSPRRGLSPEASGSQKEGHGTMSVSAGPRIAERSRERDLQLELARPVLQPLGAKAADGMEYCGSNRVVGLMLSLILVAVRVGL